MNVLKPKTEAQVEEAIAWALETKTPVTVKGQGTKSRFAPPATPEHTLDLGNVSGILSYEPDELVISALVATPVSTIEEALKQEGQHLAFEPPGLVPNATLGGLVSAGSSGPRRLAAGGVRDHILGLSGVTGRAQSFKIGGRVVKNVTGYDLSKLLTGSWGTLAVMTRITMKVLPAPPETRTLRLTGNSRDKTLNLLRRAAASPYQVTGAALLTEGDGVVRLEGRDDEIDQRFDLLNEMLDGPTQKLETEASVSIWQDVGSLAALSKDEPIWRVECPRSLAHDVLALVPDHKALVDWAGARLWLSGDLSDADQSAIQALGARLSLLRGDESDWHRQAARVSETPALAALQSRIRDAFDPLRLLNPHVPKRG